MSAQTQIGRPHPGYGDQEEPQDGPGSATPAPGAENSPGGMSRAQAYNLYTSHFLSTWNIRTYEFAAIIFTAAAYPDTLRAASVRGIVRTIASICFSSVVGRWVDRNPNRLKTLSSTICMNRLAVITSSIFWALILNYDDIFGGTFEQDVFGIFAASIFKALLFGVILILGVFENLSASGNMLSMERDWVVTAAASDGQPYDLTSLNSSMRGIDLICKLIAPILISVVVSTTNATTGVIVVAFMSMFSWGVEMWSARRAWSLNQRLQVLKVVHQDQEGVGVTSRFSHSPRGLRRKLADSGREYVRDLKMYFSATVWVPSLALAFLHLSALSYGATFITYLLSVGFSLDLITIARAAGSVVEISSTLVTPVGVKYLGNAVNHGRPQADFEDDEEASTMLLEGTPNEAAKTETGLERLGLWGITWQVINLIPVIYVLWSLTPNTTPLEFSGLISRFINPLTSKLLLGFTLFFFLSTSRLGLWIYDLTTQQLTQTMTTPSQRSSFTGVEYGFVSFFELGQHILTIVLHRPDQFKWIALVSWTTVVISALGYAGWVWKMRGHLVHWERFGKGCKC